MSADSNIQEELINEEGQNYGQPEMPPEQEMYDDDSIPVFLINGFLESGKTSFLRFTLIQEYFKTDGKTLLVCCEDGEEDYPIEVLKQTNTALVRISDESEISKDSIAAMIEAYKPERLIIEWNGMWQQQNLILPNGTFLNQQITIVDTSTFDLYLKNMKPLLGQMLRYSELVICNRADDIDESVLKDYRTKIKAMAQNAEIIFEGKSGELTGDFSIDLPYDIDADDIVVKPDDYGIFYLDIMDRPERYDGKKVSFTGSVLAPPELGKDAFVVGRRVMTCCEADVQFLGPICRYGKAGAYHNGDWVKIKGELKCETNPQYGGRGPIIYISDIVRTGKIDELAGF